ncbi:MAG: hypothetical protein ACREGC_03430, partial [Minisyncoccia bacterium]
VQYINLNGANIVAAMDWDGDGRTDLLGFIGFQGGVFLSQGNFVSAPVDGGFSILDAMFPADQDGDGLDDLFYFNSGDYFYSKLHNSPGAVPDLVASISDGYGNSFNPTYAPTSWSNYSKTGTGSVAFPYQYYQGPVYVVNQFSATDGIGGSYTNQFNYTQMLLNRQRGLTGFQSRTSTDSRNHLTEVQTFRQDFPFTGALIGDTVTQQNGKPVSAVSNVYLETTLNSAAGAQRYFPFVQQSTMSRYEVEAGGAKDGQLITQVQAQYTYDDYGNIKTSTIQTTDEDISSPYYLQSHTVATTNWPTIDTANWCLTLSSETQVAYTTTDGGAPVTRTVTFPSPDTAKCRYNSTIVEPSSAIYAVTKSFGYDSFGNLHT